MSDELQAILQGIPDPLKGVPERPFGSKGVVLNIPPQLLVEGAVLDAKNLFATEVGLKRRPGSIPFTSTNTVADSPIQDAIGFWKVTGLQDLLVLDQKSLYKATPSTGYTKVYDKWEVGGKFTTTGASSLVTGIRTKFASAGIIAGDTIILDVNGTPSYFVIVSVDTELQLTVTGTPGAYATATAFKISRPFRAANPWFVDSTILTGGTPRTLFADGFYPVRGYDGTTLEDYGLINNGTIQITTGTATVTGTNTTFLDSGVVAGDLVVLDFDGSEGVSTGCETLVVQTVNSNTSITTTGNAVSTHNAGTDYRIVQVGRPRPHCVCYHKDRVWIANTIETGSNLQLRQRIRWTALGDLDNFTLGGYLDLPYTQGSIKRLVPMGDFLIAYFDDAIFIGRPTSFGTNPLSFQQIETGNVGLLGQKAVTRYLNSHLFVGQDDIYLLSTGGIEKIGTPVIKRTIQGCTASRHWMIQVAPDQINERVLFGFPKSSNEMEELWSYSYRSRGWTYDLITCQSLSSNSYVAALQWDTFVTAPYSTGTVTGVISDQTLTGIGTTWTAGVCATGDSVLIDIDGDGNYEFVTTVSSRTSNTELEMVNAAPSTFGVGKNYRIVKAAATWGGTQMQAYPTWDSFGSLATTLKDVFLGKNDNLWKYDNTTNLDGTSAISTLIITKDYDYNLPDNNKFWGTFGLKMETWNESTNPIVFQVECSSDRGQHWSALGNLTIAINQDEGRVTVRKTGAIMRFRLTSTSLVNSYTITEVVIRARKAGRDTSPRGDQL